MWQSKLGLIALQFYERLNPPTLGQKRCALAVSVSFGLHATLVLILGTVWLTATVRSSIPTVDSRWNDDTAAVELLEEFPEPVPVMTTVQDRGGSARGQSVQGEQRESIAALAVQLDGGRPTESLTGPDVPDDLAAEVGALAPSGPAGTGDGAGTGGTGQFFGNSVAGRRFVFVVDASKSMNHPHPSEAKTRFGRVKLELVNSIRNMDRNSEFYIVFFNEHAIPMPAKRLQKAEPANQLRYLEWVAYARADGQTDPREALQVALRLKPDVVFFLTDGNFPYFVVGEVQAINRGRAQIHTYCFGDRTGEKFLQQIAQQNGGQYRYIP